MEDWTDWEDFSERGALPGREGRAALREEVVVVVVVDLLVEEGEDGEEEVDWGERISDFRAESFSDSTDWSFESSAATRCWM